MDTIPEDIRSGVPLREDDVFIFLYLNTVNCLTYTTYTPLYITGTTSFQNSHASKLWHYHFYWWNTEEKY